MEGLKWLHVYTILDDWVHSFQSAAAVVLNNSVRVVVYSGVEDYICNYLGGKAWAETAQWSGSVSAPIILFLTHSHSLSLSLSLSLSRAHTLYCDILFPSC